MSKILEDFPPERVLLDRGPGCYAKVSSNLLRLARISLLSGHRHFCANLLNLSKFRCRVKLRFHQNLNSNFTSTAGRFSCLSDRLDSGNCPLQKVALRKISNSNRRLNRPAHFARARRLASWVMQWFLFSAGFPTGVRGATCTTSSNPTNRLPTSH